MTLPTMTEAPKTTKPEISDADREAAVSALTQCGSEGADPGTSVEVLHLTFAATHDCEVRTAWLAAAVRTITGVCALVAVTADVRVRMMLVFGDLVDLSGTIRGSEAKTVDELLAAWLRYPQAFGAGHVAPEELQRPVVIQRVGDLLGSEVLHIQRNRKPLQRFADWVNGWKVSAKYGARRALQAVNRNFPADDVWSRVTFPEGQKQHRPEDKPAPRADA